jgi:hypothetical protein
MVNSPEKTPLPNNTRDNEGVYPLGIAGGLGLLTYLIKGRESVLQEVGKKRRPHSDTTYSRASWSLSNFSFNQPQRPQRYLGK